MYYKPENGQRFTDHSNIRSTSGIMFTEIIEDSELEARGIFPVQPTKPVVGANEVATEGVPELTDGGYKQTWVITEATQEQLAVKAAKLTALRAAKNIEINHARGTANQTYFVHANKQIACDALSRSDIDAVANHISLFGTFPADFPGAWKAIDNSYIMLASVDAFKDMYSSMTKQGTANFAKSQELKAVLAAATTEEDVAAITW